MTTDAYEMRVRGGRRPRPAEAAHHDEEGIARWFTAQIPGDWFTGPPEVSVDSEEILVVGRLPDLDRASGRSPEEKAVEEANRVAAFREETREARISIASRAEQGFGRRVSWGAECGSTRRLYTTASVPVMTRLRMGDRRVLDTLVAAGVARSRSEALAWCVRLVAEHEADWLEDLRQALVQVGQVRAEGPRAI